MARADPLLIELASGGFEGVMATITHLQVNSAIEHRMQGLLWAWVETGNFAIESEASELLATSVLSARVRSRRLSEAAADLSSELSHRDLDVAVFKGIATERRWYKRQGERPAVDLDLWLAPHQLDHAGEVVERIQPNHPLADQISSLVSNRRIRSVDLVWNGIPVDLHFDPFKFGVWYEGLEEVWADTEDLGDGYRTMGSAAELLVALLHLNKDRFSRLLGFVDVVRASARPEVAEKTWRLATEIGVSVPVACSAQAVGETLGMDIPIPAPRPGWRTRAWSRLWPEKSRLLGSGGYQQMRHRQDLIPLLCDGRSSEAIAHLRHVWFPPRALLDYFNPHVKGLPYPLALWKARTN